MLAGVAFLAAALPGPAGAARHSASASTVGLIGTTSRVSAQRSLMAKSWVQPLASTADSGDGVPYAVFERFNRSANNNVDASGHLLAVMTHHRPYVFGTVTPDMSNFSVAAHAFDSTSGLSTVYDYGHVVGWASSYRNMATANSPVLSLPPGEQIWALSHFGVITKRELPYKPPSRPTATFSLRAYGGTSERLLISAPYLDAAPQIAGNIIAWIDQYGHLEASALG